MNPLALQVLLVASHVPERLLGPSLLDWSRPSIPPLPPVDVHAAVDRDVLASPAPETAPRK